MMLPTPERIQALVEPIKRQYRQSLSQTFNRTHPATPSEAVTLEIPLKVPVAKGGMVVCIRTLTASNGQRATSAMTSAEALATR